MVEKEIFVPHLLQLLCCCLSAEWIYLFWKSQYVKKGLASFWLSNSQHTMEYCFLRCKQKGNSILLLDICKDNCYCWFLSSSVSCQLFLQIISSPRFLTGSFWVWISCKLGPKGTMQHSNNLKFPPSLSPGNGNSRSVDQNFKLLLVLGLVFHHS